LAEKRQTQSLAVTELDVVLPTVPEGQQFQLALDARIDWERPAGSNPWKVGMAEWLRREGKTIIGNGPPRARTMLDLHIPRFTEMASYSFLLKTHLSSPWGLANHDPDYTVAGHARQARRFLDYAGVLTSYVWPSDPEVPTFQPLMYPITPVELRAGMVLGEERILTNRSGRYGWPDGSQADVYVINAQGRCVSKPQTRTVREDGRRLIEVRMPGDHFAILVRNPDG
jgi:hypothetical protein